MSHEIPAYSKGEEIFNWVSHTVGAAFGVGVLTYCIIMIFIKKLDAIEATSLIFYSVSMITLYISSTIYHALSNKGLAKRIFRVIDHSTIYLLIVGTYAPMCALGLRGSNYDIIIMSIETLCTLVGILLNIFIFRSKITKIVSIFLYVIMGWLILFVYPAFEMFNDSALLYVLLGGIAYTVGVLFYAIGKKKKWMHSVFHLFILVGSILQFVGLIILIIS